MRIPHAAAGALSFVFLAALSATPAVAQPAHAGARVSVQPIEGEHGESVRGQIARLLRGHGYRAVANLARVSGTGQYPELARDNKLTAFVTADLEEGRHRAAITFLVWDGATGSVQGRWSVSAAPKGLGKAIAKGFWKALGSKLDALEPPPSDELEPAAPMYVNAGEPLD
ncbi:MAG TPA: hypothetical protein VHJ20_01330 [Polyangia bacterium]|nr:hypothetical protein [Polyangia bacterium]